jgi:type III restriction/modification enzyme restriction subunit
LPNETSDRIYTHNIDKAKRLYVATLQTISRCYEQFSPAFFDLLVFDEAHRSIFNRLNEVMEYFDARMIGLTATPAGFIERDTFRVSIATAKRRQRSIPMPKPYRRDTLSISAFIRQKPASNATASKALTCQKKTRTPLSNKVSTRMTSTIPAPISSVRSATGHAR